MFEPVLYMVAEGPTQMNWKGVGKSFMKGGWLSWKNASAIATGGLRTSRSCSPSERRYSQISSAELEGEQCYVRPGQERQQAAPKGEGPATAAHRRPRAAARTHALRHAGVDEGRSGSG